MASTDSPTIISPAFVGDNNVPTHFFLPIKIWFSRNAPAPTEGMWYNVTLSYCYHNYQVMYLETVDGYFLKPDPTVNQQGCSSCPMEKRYGDHSCEYQDLFGFGSHCSGFNPERTVYIEKVQRA
jgi:hypothetical protein